MSELDYDWKKCIKINDYHWLREPDREARNTPVEAARLYEWLQGGGEFEYVSSGPKWLMTGCIGSDYYHRPRLDLPELPDGYMFFGQGPVPEELGGGCLTLVDEEWEGFFDGDGLHEVYAVRKSAWEEATKPKLTEWQRFVALVEGADYVLRQDRFGSWSVIGLTNSTDNHRAMNKITEPWTIEEWRAAAITGEYVRETSLGNISALSTASSSTAKSMVETTKTLYRKGKEVKAETTKHVVVATWDAETQTCKEESA